MIQSQQERALHAQKVQELLQQFQAKDLVAKRLNNKKMAE